MTMSKQQLRQGHVVFGEFPSHLSYHSCKEILSCSEAKSSHVKDTHSSLPLWERMWHIPRECAFGCRSTSIAPPTPHLGLLTHNTQLNFISILKCLPKMQRQTLHGEKVPSSTHHDLSKHQLKLRQQPNAPPQQYRVQPARRRNQIHLPWLYRRRMNKKNMSRI